MGDQRDVKFVGDKYAGLSIYEYKNTRKIEKNAISKPKLAPETIMMREKIWNKLLKNTGEDFNSYQVFRTHAYVANPNPNEAEENEGAINILESQRRFMQYKNPEFIPGKKLKHLDLTSAYATALAGLDKSLKFFTSFELDSFSSAKDACGPKHFNIVDFKIKTSYDTWFNLYAPNTRIMYKYKKVSDTNVPPAGSEVWISFKLLQSEIMNIRGLQHFMDDLVRHKTEYEIVKLKVSTYNIIKREAIYQYHELDNILQESKKLNKVDRVNVKSAIVAFTGMLMNIDPGMRLIMLARSEEIIHQIRNHLLTAGVDIWGVQIDGIYYTSNQWFDKYPDHFENRIKEIIETVLQHNVEKYGVKSFLKVEDWDENDYKETAFRLQEVRK